MDVTIGHAWGAPAVPIRSASVEVSFDGGQTWTPTALADQGGGHYRACWMNPAGGDVSLRVTAADTDGVTLTQSVLGAAPVRSS